MFNGINRIIRPVVVLLSALVPVASAWPETALPAGYPASPQLLFDGLFDAVQMSGIYTDSKAFADATAQTAPQEILQQYRQQRPGSPAALQHFVEAHFTLPAAASSVVAQPQHVAIEDHIDALWNQLTRSTTATPSYSSLLSMPHPYVVPGGRFREMYYWDSYFTMLGLATSGRHDLVEDMVRNFAYLIDTYGHIPNGTRSYYLSRSQPPFFFAMVGLLSDNDPAKYFAQFLPQLKQEYAFWMQGADNLKAGAVHRRVVALADGAILNRYWDDRDTPRDESYREDTQLARLSKREPRQLFRDIRAAAESGWDFSSRWFANARSRDSIVTTEIVPADLNSLMFGLENAIRAGCERNADAQCVAEFQRRATARRAAVDRYLWDARAGAYLDYRWTHKARIARVSAATLYPLFVGLASQPQADAVAVTISNNLLRAGGIVTTPLATTEQWDAPNGWAPLQWLAVSGLNQYGNTLLASTIACRWMLNVRRVYAQDGKLVEKYDVIATDRSGGGGEYPLQDGFGWTNGVMRKFIALYPAQNASSADQCSHAAAAS